MGKVGEGSCQRTQRQTRRERDSNCQPDRSLDNPLYRLSHSHGSVSVSVKGYVASPWARWPQPMKSVTRAERIQLEPVASCFIDWSRRREDVLLKRLFLRRPVVLLSKSHLPTHDNPEYTSGSRNETLLSALHKRPRSVCSHFEYK